MKHVDQIKAQKLVDIIQRGHFDENDVDSLLMKLRASCFGHEIIREIGDFIAHNDARNKGITFESLEGTYLSFMFFSEYINQNKKLDILQPFPIYIKKLMKYQIRHTEESTFKKKIHISAKKLLVLIDTYFIENKRTEEIIPKSINDNKFLQAISGLLSVIIIKPTFEQKELIDQLIKVLKANKLKFYEDQIRLQSPKIIISILLLLHYTEFDFKGGIKGYCCISSVADGAFPNGKLNLLGHVPCKINGEDLIMVFTVFDTDLDTTISCETTLNIQGCFLKELCLNEDFKLSKFTD